MKKMRFIARLSAYLMTAAVVTSLVNTPVCTYAATKNRVTTVVSVAKDTELDGNKAPSLILELDDDLDVGTTFYLELKNADWILDDVTVTATNIGGTAEFDVKAIDKNEIAVTLKKVLAEDSVSEEAALPADALIRIKLASKVKKASASVIIDAEGTVITSSSSGIEYAKVNTTGATAKVSEVKSFTTDGTIGDITVEEAYEGAFAENLNRNGKFVMTLKLDNSDVEFTGTKKVTVTGVKGLTGVTGTVTQTEDDELTVTINGSSLEGLEKGGLKISGINIGTVDDETISGTVGIDIESDAFKTLSVQVAKFVKNGISIDVTPYSTDNKSGLIAGRSGEYKLVITESSEDVLLDGKRLDFTLENGYFIDADTTNSKTALSIFEREVSLPSELSLDSVTLDDTKVIGFSATVTTDEDEIDEFTLKVPVAVDLDTIENLIFDETEVAGTSEESQNTTDDSSSAVFGSGEDGAEVLTDTAKTTKKKEEKIPKVKLNVTGRALSGEEASVDIAEVIQPVTISLQEKVYKLGLKDQEGTDIVITEEAAGRLDKGTLVITFDDAQGMSFTKAPTVEVTKGDLKLGKGELIRSGNSITGIKFNISKTSRTASEITISNILVTVDRTVPEGKVGLLVGGTSLTEGKPVASTLYAKITDTNVSDASDNTATVIQNQLDKLQQSLQTPGKPLTAVFTMNATSYTVNGETKQMDGAPYVSGSGRTMIPVRYVADALGIDTSKILSNSGIVTILGSDSTVQFKLNSNIMLKNGAQIPMDEKAVLKDGRTYIPVSYAATALGVDASYDSATKTVTFKNAAAKASQTNVLNSPSVSTTDTASQSQNQNTSTDANASDLFSILDDLK